MMQNKPYPFEVKAGRMYLWCACGKSKTQPLCDGSHSVDERPVAFEVEKDKRVFLCGCKQTNNPPFCDGGHQFIDNGGRDVFFDKYSR